MSAARDDAYPLALDNWFARTLPSLTIPWKATPLPKAKLVFHNADLAKALGLDADLLQTPAGMRQLFGTTVDPKTTPVAMAYAGHQFAHYSPRLGDGRALLIGELTDPAGTKHDVHLKGSGRTPFSRGGDGKGTLASMLREVLISEALHALGVPTTRSLAVITTGETIQREAPAPGAVLARVAASHLRVGTFEYTARLGDNELLETLLEHATLRHYPQAATADDPARALLQHVMQAQAELIARWMLIGFVHGVMNTDNMTISGEGIDYGPCAFMDRYDPATVFSSIDQHGRYAYGNQPRVAQWNLARLAETLLPLMKGTIDEATTNATAVLEDFPATFRTAWHTGMRTKLGLVPGDAPDASAEDAPSSDASSESADEETTLLSDLLKLLASHRADYTSTFRALASDLRGDKAPLAALVSCTADLDAWVTRWRARLAQQGADLASVADGMDAVNPVYIPRNHLVESALESATAGDMAPFHELLAVVTTPYTRRPDHERFAQPAPDTFTETFQTFCGT